LGGIEATTDSLFSFLFGVDVGDQDTIGS